MSERGGRAKGVAGVAASGETTQDLRPAPPLQPDAEARARTRGPWMVAIGFLIIGMTVAVAAVWHLGFHYEMPLPFVLPMYVFGFCALLLGWMEYLGRPIREYNLQEIEQLRRVERGLLLLADLLPEEMRQQFYLGYGRCAEEMFSATGTDDRRAGHGTGDVLRLRRR